MLVYLLVILISGKPVTSIEFTSKESCEIARLKIATKNLRNGIEDSSVCVLK